MWPTHTVPEVVIWRTASQLAHGLAVMHTGYGTHRYKNDKCKWSTIVHNDMKPNNVFVGINQDDPNSPTIKLGDFGLAQFHRIDDLHDTGSPMYWPPEYPLTTPAKDVWGLGGILYYMARWRNPPSTQAGSQYGEETLAGTYNPETDKRVKPGRLPYIQEMRKIYGLRMRACINVVDNAPDSLTSHAYSNALNSLLMACWEEDRESRVESQRLAAWVEVAAEAAIEQLQRGKSPNFDLKTLCKTSETPSENVAELLQSSD